MALTSCEVTWLQALLKDLGLNDLPPVVMHCDNKAAISIAANLILYERTKHVDIDYNFVQDKLNSGSMVNAHVPSHLQIADLFTKGLSTK